jgi:hypothetical protein
MRVIAAALAMLALSACCTTPEPVVIREPVCPVALGLPDDPMPTVPDGAGLPAPADEAEAEALRLTLGWVAELSEWGRAGWSRVALARAGCS